MDGKATSVVEDQGFYATSCGYCKSRGPTSVAYGLRARSLSPYDYQELLDQSWRRSGTILYKPEVGESCCPAYTIRLKVDCMENSKDHARVMLRMQRYLDGIYMAPSPKKLATEADTDLEMPQCQTCDIDVDISGDEPDKIKPNQADKELLANLLSSEIRLAIKECSLRGDLPENLEIPKISMQTLQKASCKRGGGIASGEVCYTSNFAFPCAAALLKQKSDCKVVKSAYSQCQGAEDKTLHRRVAAVLADTIAVKLKTHEKLSNYEVQACNGHLNFVVTGPDNLIRRNSSPMRGNACKEVNLKGEKSSKVSRSAKSLQALEAVHTKRRLEIRTTASVFDPEEFSLYRKYQITVHNDRPEDVTEDSFRRFLVDTPLTFVPPSTEGGDCFRGLGSFHQQYLIDGQLVAVGVLDVLPTCLSSNYFFWDPDFAFLSLGKFSALKEIEWVRRAKTYWPSLDYYYLGHYIHSCPKMHYKVTFRPSELLCPVRVQWVPFELACVSLDKEPYACLSDCLYPIQKGNQNCRMEDGWTDLTLGDVVKKRRNGMDGTKVDGFSESEAMKGLKEAGGCSVDERQLNSILLKFEDYFLRFKQLREWIEDSEEGLDDLISKLTNYSKLVGANLATRMAYVLA